MPHAKRPSASSSASKGNKGAAPQQQSEMEWGGFINISLSENQHKAFEAYTTDNPEPAWDAVSSLLFDGGKITFSYNPINDTTNCSVTGAIVPGIQKRFTLSCFAPDWRLALLLLAFKWDVIAQRDLEAWINPGTATKSRFG